MTAPPPPSRSFRNRRFWGLLGFVAVTFAVVYPFSPFARQQRQMATMRLFGDQLKAELAGDPALADLDCSVSTLVHLLVRVERPLDDAAWQRLLDRVRAKRDAYRHVSGIAVWVDTGGPGSRSAAFDSK